MSTVSSIRDFFGNVLVFDRITYSNVNGLPIENELIVNTTSAENCCIACQKTVSSSTALQTVALTNPIMSSPTAPPLSSSPPSKNATCA
jgi:hypothetical protein